MTEKEIPIKLESYKHIPACEITGCYNHMYCGTDDNGEHIYGCRFAESGLTCDDFNNPDEACYYRQLEWYKDELKRKEQECANLKDTIKLQNKMQKEVCDEKNKEIDQLKEEKTRLEEDFAVQLQATLYHQSQWLKSEKKCINYEQILKEIRQKIEVLDD